MFIKTTLLSGSDAISANLQHSLAFFLKSSGPPIAQPHVHLCSIDLMYDYAPRLEGVEHQCGHGFPSLLINDRPNDLRGRTNLHAHENMALRCGSERSRSASTGASQGTDRDRPRPWAYEIHIVPSTTQANDIRNAPSTNLFSLVCVDRAAIA